MREIKFRVWDNFNKKWFDPEMFSIACDNGTLTNKKCAGSIGGVLIMQYTGLKDKNGKEIYEGDIVKDLWYEYIDDLFVVSCKDGRFSPLVYVEEGYNCIDKYDPERFEIIGNIHENPELIK